MKIAGWGNYPLGESDLVSPLDPSCAGAAITHAKSIIARGAGRAYGDPALGVDRTLFTNKLNRFIAFDDKTLELSVEAGTLLSDIIAIMLPRGYFPAVVPGTQFVTIGGMVAANIHGKNHHRAGGFGRQVTRLKLAVADGTIVACGPTEIPDLFRATIGGMGLTGVITEVTFRLIRVESAFICQETVIAQNLDASMRVFEDSKEWTYTVAWIDGLAKGNALGRSLIYRGEHARIDELDERQARYPFSAKAPLALGVPFFVPNVALNRLTVKAFNAAYYLNGARHEGAHIAGWFPYFFPLDAIANWNRIYGVRGFIQHQCVIPKAKSRDAIGEILSVIGRLGNPSFLAVLKLLGPDDDGLMTFPMEGYTLAIDFPVSEKTFRLAKELDRVVASYGGRLYLAKDARQSRSMVEMGYPNIEEFRALRRQTGASGKFRSLQSERLGL